MLLAALVGAATACAVRLHPRTFRRSRSMSLFLLLGYSLLVTLLTAQSSFFFLATSFYALLIAWYVLPTEDSYDSTYDRRPTTHSHRS